MNSAAIEVAIGTVLKYVDEDSGREGLWRTPERVAEMYGELFSGVGKDPADEIDAIFSDDVAQDPVLIRGAAVFLHVRASSVAVFWTGQSGLRS